MTLLRWIWWLVALAVFVAVGAAASAADAYVYWENEPGSIGRANLDGSGVNPTFLSTPVSGSGMAVDRAHLYWSSGYAIGRANLDGTGAKPGFLGAGAEWGVAVDDAHIFWATGRDSRDAIARANLDGSGRNYGFIPVETNEIAVDASHIYWTVGKSCGSVPCYAIGRANLDGTGVNKDFIDLGESSSPWGIAVDGAHIYWTDQDNEFHTSGTIGRADLNGTNVNLNFVPNAGHPLGIAVDGGYIYWANETGNGVGSIARANLDGSNVNLTQIRGGGFPSAIAVDASPVIPSTSSIAFQSRPEHSTSPWYTVTAKNTGATAVTFSAVSLTGTNAASFQTGSDTCTGQTLTVGGSCTIQVRFSPLAAGVMSASLRFTDNAYGAPTTVSLSGTSTPSAWLTTSVQGLKFGHWKVGTTSPSQNVTVTNVGSAALSISSVTIQGANPGDFTGLNQTCTTIGTLNPGDNCTAQVAFAPTALGTHTATIVIDDTAPKNPHKVSVTGTGI